MKVICINRRNFELEEQTEWNIEEIGSVIGPLSIWTAICRSSDMDIDDMTQKWSDSDNEFLTGS